MASKKCKICRTCEKLRLSCTETPFEDPNDGKNSHTFFQCACGQRWWQSLPGIHFWQKIDKEERKPEIVAKKFWSTQANFVPKPLR